MSSHHSRGPLPSHGSTMTNEELQRVRYMAHMERRARPPTFRPLTIVVVVLSLGLFVIGLVMIVIAHWPGVSGGDSLKIAGGVLLAVGGVIFIIAMIVTCVLRNQEQERFEKSIASLQASRSNLSVISRRTPMTTPTPSLDAKPGKSILKKTPSTSTYGTNRGSVFGEDDSGVGNAYNTSFGQNHSYEQGSTNSDSSAGKYEVYRIETLPDPSQARLGKNGMLPQSSLSGSGGLGNTSLTAAGVLDHSGSTDSEAQVLPTPVRNTKRRRGQSPSVVSGGRPNPSYSPDAGEISVTQEVHTQAAAPTESSMHAGRSIQHYSNEGYDMYEGDTQGSVPQPIRKKKSGSRDPEAKEKRRKPQKQQEVLAPDAAYAGAGAGAGQYPPVYHNQGFAPQEVDLGHSAVQQTVTRTTTKHVTRSAYPAQDVSGGQLDHSNVSEELRINIKAQPGTAVHITPTTTRAYKPVTSPSQSSVETEI